MKLIQIYWMALTISGLCYLAFWFAPDTYSSFSPDYFNSQAKKLFDDDAG